MNILKIKDILAPIHDSKSLFREQDIQNLGQILKHVKTPCNHNLQ